MNDRRKEKDKLRKDELQKTKCSSAYVFNVKEFGGNALLCIEESSIENRRPDTSEGVFFVSEIADWIHSQNSPLKAPQFLGECLKGKSDGLSYFYFPEVGLDAIFSETERESIEEKSTFKEKSVDGIFGVYGGTQQLELQLESTSSVGNLHQQDQILNGILSEKADLRVEYTNSNLDASQESAVRCALQASGRTIFPITGPPGTGKSHLAAQLVKYYSKKGRILFSCHGNKAADRIVEVISNEFPELCLCRLTSQEGEKDAVCTADQIRRVLSERKVDKSFSKWVTLKKAHDRHLLNQGPKMKPEKVLEYKLTEQICK